MNPTSTPIFPIVPAVSVVLTDSSAANCAARSLYVGISGQPDRRAAAPEQKQLAPVARLLRSTVKRREQRHRLGLLLLEPRVPAIRVGEPLVTLRDLVQRAVERSEEHTSELQ